MKKCNRCQEEKPFNQFGKKGNGYQSYCIPCRRIKQKEWLNADPARKEKAKIRAKEWEKNNPERARKNKQKSREKNLKKIKENASHQHRQRVYGLSKNEYEQMLIKQGKVCAICNKKTKLWVDHDHKNGKVRGLLCPSCNNLIGYLETYNYLIDKANNYINDSEHNT